MRGGITFRVGGTDDPLGPGDRLRLPAGTVHAAVVQPDGADYADYLIGERR